MRVCDRCKTPDKKSVKTMRDQHGGEVELCRECDALFIEFLNGTEKKQESAGKSAKR